KVCPLPGNVSVAGGARVCRADVGNDPGPYRMEAIAMNFAQPRMLWLLLITLPLLAFFFYLTWRKKQRMLAQFVQSRLLAQLTVGVSKTRQQVRLAMIVLAVGLVILALARPRWGFAW